MASDRRNTRRRPAGASLLLVALLCVRCGWDDPLEEAEQYQQAGRYEEAIETLKPLIDQGSRDPEVLFFYGVNLRLAGRPGLALAALHQARRSEGWEVTAGLELAAAAHDARAWPTAIEAASVVIEHEPDNLLAYVLRAQARMEARTDQEGALADLDRALELDPENVAIQLGRVAHLLTLERVEEAGEILRDIETIANPDTFTFDERAGFCVAQATFERESGEPEAASQAFEGCLERYGLASPVVIAAVEHYDRVGDRERGNEILATLVESAPRAFVPRALLARRLHSSGEVDRAHALLVEGGELSFPLAAAHSLSTLAELYSDAGRFDDAARVFGRVRELEGDQGPQRILAHAELLALAGNHERALELAEELGDHVYRHLVRATVSFGERDARGALGHLDAALVEWPDNAAAQYYAGRAAERLGEFSRATDAYRNSIRAGADQTDAGVKLAELHRAAGRYREAYVAVRHHLKEQPADTDAALLAVEIAVQLDEQTLQASLEALPGNQSWARAATLLSDAVAEHRGATAAVELLRADPRIDLQQPRDADAIEALIRHLRAAGRDAEALATAERLVARQPDDPRLHWILSLASDGAAAQRALDRTLELDPAHGPAILARARRAADAGSVEETRAWIAKLDPMPTDLLLEASLLLAAVGDEAKAEALLEDLLWERPHDAGAARELTRLRLARGAGDEPRTLELAERSTRFGGGTEAQELLARVLETREAQGLGAVRIP